MPKFVALAALTASLFPIAASWADDFDNANAVAISLEMQCSAFSGNGYRGCYHVDGLHEGFIVTGFHVDDVHQNVQLFVPNGRRSDAEALADGACKTASDGTLSWDKQWTVSVLMNYDLAAQCIILRQTKTKPFVSDNASDDTHVSHEAGKHRDGFDDLLKGLAAQAPGPR